MADRKPFSDIRTAVMDLIEDLGEVGTKTPPDLQSHLPFHRVTRYGGSDDWITDTSFIDIDTWMAIAPGSLDALPEAVRQRMLSWPHVVGSVVIDRVFTLKAPNEVPETDPTMARYTAAYRVTSRRTIT